MSGADVVARADAGQVSGILRNVLENAVRAAGPQGMVHLALYAAADQLAVIDVWDSGPGVPPSERERIFERLVRLDHGRIHDSGGSGLGLAIARGYARAHGGDLRCEDPRGPGALFRLTLPLEPRPTGRVISSRTSPRPRATSSVPPAGVVQAAAVSSQSRKARGRRPR